MTIIASPTKVTCAHVTLVGLAMMVIFHAYITSHCPVAVPLEWNFVMVFGGIFLFHDGMPDVGVLVHAPTVMVVLILCVFVVPLVGHLAPQRISFLLAMRYYAGNWPYSVWLCQDGVLERISQAFITAVMKACEIRSRTPSWQSQTEYGQLPA